MDADLAFAGRIALAALLGAVIGLEREISDQPAGFRTHVMVALGAALFGIISTDGFLRFAQPRADTNVQLSVERVASQVVVGIGFLGAGAIVKQGGSIRGLTTAASLWVTAAVGLAVGITAYGAAIVTTVAVLVALVVLRLPRAWVRRALVRSSRMLVLQVAPGADAAEVVRAVRALEGIEVRGLTLRPAAEGDVIEVHVRARVEGDLRRAIDDLDDRDDVISIERP